MSLLRLSGEPTRDYVNWAGVDVRPWFHVKLKNGTEFDFRACPPLFFMDTGIPRQRRENT
ncbi:MAG: hypothetical protein HDT18_06630 [Oscillibacter sp.]|nr:hypothetical protein [Oscillibacter sp.]